MRHDPAHTARMAQVWEAHNAPTMRREQRASRLRLAAVIAALAIVAAMALHVVPQAIGNLQHDLERVGHGSP